MHICMHIEYMVMSLYCASIGYVYMYVCMVYIMADVLSYYLRTYVHVTSTMVQL